MEHAFVEPTFWMNASQSNIGLINPNVPSQAKVCECWQIAATLECLGLLALSTHQQVSQMLEHAKDNKPESDV